jgi:hypothetical protein
MAAIGGNFNGFTLYGKNLPHRCGKRIIMSGRWITVELKLMR